MSEVPQLTPNPKSQPPPGAAHQTHRAEGREATLLEDRGARVARGAPWQGAPPAPHGARPVHPIITMIKWIRIITPPSAPRTRPRSSARRVILAFRTLPGRATSQARDGECSAITSGRTGRVWGWVFLMSEVPLVPPGMGRVSSSTGRKGRRHPTRHSSGRRPSGLGLRVRTDRRPRSSGTLPHLD